MADIHLKRMAHVLVNYSLGIKKGDRLGIRTPVTAAPLVKEIYREALRAGGLPETFLSLPGLGEIFYKEASSNLPTYRRRSAFSLANTKRWFRSGRPPIPKN